MENIAWLFQRDELGRWLGTCEFDHLSVELRFVVVEESRLEKRLGRGGERGLVHGCGQSSEISHLCGSVRMRE